MQLKCFFSLRTVELHVLPTPDTHPTAKTRAIKFSRNPDLHDDDPNVQILRALEQAGAAKIKELIASGAV